MKMWKIGLGATAMVLGLGAIGAVTVMRGGANVPTASAAPASSSASTAVAKPLPLLTPHTAPITNIANLKAAAAATPADPQNWANVGNATLGARDYDGAVDAYKKAVALDPAKADAWSGLGEAYVHAINSSNSKMPVLARAAFDKALALNPNDVRARFYITLERDYNGEHDEAVAAWLGLLRAVPAGSPADAAIGDAILASLNRNIRLVSAAVKESRQLQPKASPAKS